MAFSLFASFDVAKLVPDFNEREHNRADKKRELQALLDMREARGSEHGRIEAEY
jgi:hypothetical protein